MSEDDHSESPTSTGPIASGSNFRKGYTPTLKPGEQLLPPSEQEKLLKRRARDHDRYWRAKEQKEAAAHRASPNNDMDIDMITHDDQTAAQDIPEAGDANDYSSSAESEDEDEKLHCICQTRYEGERIMICCDRCDGWYHPECLKMKETQVKLVDMFICPKCAKTTSDRTTFKVACIRNACSEPANPPLSRYCSERCGVLVALSKIAKTKYGNAKTGADIDKLMSRQVKAAHKREGMVVWQEPAALASPGENHIADIWFQRLSWGDTGTDRAQSPSDSTEDTTLTATSTREEEDLYHLKRDLAALLHRKSKHSAALDLVMARHKLLQLAEDRLVSLPSVTVVVEETSAAKRGKSKGAAKSQDQLKTQPRCGYDERLSWDDEAFTEWMISQHGAKILTEEITLDGRIDDENSSQDADNTTDGTDDDNSLAGPTICGLAKRKCKRHSDWSTTRGLDFEAEKEVQTASLSRCSEQESHLREQISEIEATLRARRTAEDARLAMGLAQGAAARRRGGAFT